MPTDAEIEAQLTGPGAPFEIAEEDVLGERMHVFKNRQKSLREVLDASRALGDAEYIVVDDGRRYTFADNLRIVSAVASALERKFDVGKGDRVAILAANCPEWIFTFWATVSLGAIAVGLNGWWAGDEIVYGLDDADPKLLVADTKRLDRIRTRDHGRPVVEIETDFDVLADPEAPSVGEPALPDTPIAEDDAAAILYTSGTTGRPKGVVNTHRNVIALSGVQVFWGMKKLMANPPPTEQPEEADAAPQQRVQLVGNPLFHVSGLYTHVVTFLMTGVKTVWTTGRFDPAKTLRLIQDEKVTGWSPMGSMAPRLVAHPDADAYDLSSVITIGSGGSPMSHATQRRLREVFPNAAPALSIGYGLTEGTALATLAGNDELEVDPDTVGRPLPTVDVEIRDPEGRPVADGVEGEICIRGPLVMKEYWRNPQATADAIRPGRRLHTGDIGTMRNGRLYVSARRRDLIIRAGENVYPAEIEMRLDAHPDVHESAVVGVDHPELGQAVKAIVVPEAGADVDPETLGEWVAEALAYFKVPEQWEIRIEHLPRNASGKVLKRLLDDDAAAHEFVEE